MSKHEREQEREQEREADSLQIDYLMNHPQYSGQVADWLFDEWGGDYPETDRPYWLAQVETRLHDDSIPLTIVASIATSGSDARRLVGTASIFEFNMEDYKQYTPWLAAVYVDSDYRRRGIGSVLVKETVEIAEKLGIKEMYLFTPDQQSFYERLGWRYLETADFKAKKVTIMKFLV